MSDCNIAASSWLQHLNADSLEAASELVLGHDDLLMQLLLHLPLKSLMKFKSVCKHWRSLISSSHFARAHFCLNPTHSIPITDIFLRRKYVPVPHALSFSSMSLSAPSTVAFPGSLVSILDSCNGLLLYYSSNSGDSELLNLHAHNPTTNQLRTIPSIIQSSFLCAALIYDPQRSNNGYKVISIHFTDISSQYALRIYSSETRKWKDWDGNNLQVPDDIALSNGVYWRGALHWVCRGESSFYFDAEREKVLQMPSPTMQWPESGNPKCCECDSKLCYLLHRYCDMVIEVYMLQNYESGWFLKCTLDLTVLVNENHLLGRGNASLLAVLCVVRSRETYGWRCMMVIHVPGKILGYNIEDGTCKEICEVSLIQGETTESLQFYWFDAYLYTQSLACI